MPNTKTSPTLTYLLATSLLFPVALSFTVFVALRYRNIKYLSQRLGLYRFIKHEQPPIWLHCASVGEVNTALPLIRSLIKKKHSLLISTSTITGQETLYKANLRHTQTIFLPLDYSLFAKQLICKHQPKVLFIFETELWPSIVLTARRHSIPTAIINARLSKKTLNAPKFIKLNYTRLLANIQQIFVGSTSDIEKFISLGARETQITMQDNLKFSTSFSQQKNSRKPLLTPFILCASTREGEELKIISQWKNLHKKDHALVIAPRHPTRIKEVCELIKKNNLTYTLHSEKPNNYTSDSVYLIDTLGELAPFMTHAEIVFVGGSLTAHGGHNVLEPASLGKCILVGTHTQNITQIINELKKHHAIKVVKNETDFIDSINQLLTNDGERRQMEENARSFVDAKKHVLPNYVTAIIKFVETHTS